MFQFSLSSSLKDYLRPGRVVIGIVSALLVFGITKTWAFFGKGSGADVIYGQAFEIIVLRVASLAAVIFALQVLSSEIESKTVVYSLTRALCRWKLLVSRTIAAALATFAVTSLSWLASGFGSLGGAALQSGAFWLDLVVVALASCAYVSLFVLASLIINRAMVACLLFAFGWETLVPNMSGDLFRFSIHPYLIALCKHVQPAKEEGILGALAGQMGPQTVSAGVAWIVLPVLSVALTAAAAWWISHFEFTAREDTG